MDRIRATIVAIIVLGLSGCIVAWIFLHTPKPRAAMPGVPIHVAPVVKRYLMPVKITYGGYENLNACYCSVPGGPPTYFSTGRSLRQAVFRGLKGTVFDENRTYPVQVRFEVNAQVIQPWDLPNYRALRRQTPPGGVINPRLKVVLTAETGNVSKEATLDLESHQGTPLSDPTMSEFQLRVHKFAVSAGKALGLGGSGGGGQGPLNTF